MNLDTSLQAGLVGRSVWTLFNLGQSLQNNSRECNSQTCFTVGWLGFYVKVLKLLPIVIYYYKLDSVTEEVALI